MNKQELIERYLKMVKLKDIIKRINELEPSAKQYWMDEILKELGSDYGRLKYRSGYEHGKLEGMVERETVKVPQIVANWIEYFKKCSGTLYGSTAPYSYYGRAITDDFEGDVTEVLGWIRDNSEVYARAWLDGYEVDEEKMYLVKIKASGQYIMKNPDENIIFFYSKRAYSKLTRKELEEAGYGWVFDCPGIEIEEVE